MWHKHGKDSHFPFVQPANKVWVVPNYRQNKWDQITSIIIIIIIIIYISSTSGRVSPRELDWMQIFLGRQSPFFLSFVLIFFSLQSRKKLIPKKIKKIKSSDSARLKVFLLSFTYCFSAQLGENFECSELIIKKEVVEKTHVHFSLI